MTTLELDVVLPASPDDVWAVVGNFGDLDTWHPWVPNCTLSPNGKTRTIDMGAMSAVETLTSEGERTHTYVVEKSPMPIRDYSCTWTAAPEGDGTRLSVAATFEPEGAPEEQAVAMLEGFFHTAFKVLRGRFA